ncbi:hypothetical protein GCM10012275_07150 [Longimycelium tulufanense]|uniref:Potassium channel domain-containing protein n=1 Tax=Longimycelium tulufanense TaxID=907463 RepID=A0A8J3CAE3_9PSEU|nr:potassium channel family protein [Longimycelium tulufanense]GGM38817.1 hypothetical protein GCM10012275_07150 [Longimycelium tulufanense]
MIIAVVRFLRVLGRAVWQPESRGLLILCGLILLGGTAFYTQAEHWSVLDALYFCVMTLTTVGYGDFTPVTSGGKIFAILFTLTGVGVFGSLLLTLAGHLIASNPLTRGRKHGSKHGQDS